MESFSLLTFLGALALFMYGIRQSRLGVQLLAGDRLRAVVGRATSTRLTALLTGISVTMILQSSTGTTAMLVGFAKAGIVTLAQAMGVLLGADIGTSLVIVLISIKKVTDYALILLVAGVLIDIFSRRKRVRYVGMVFLGFGFVFFGMQLMIRATAPLAESGLLQEAFTALGAQPIYAFLLAALFTALVQNSATAIGLTMALAFSGLVGIRQAIPLILGANVGTSFVPLLHSIGSGPAGRRVALSHLFLKAAGGAVAMALLVPLAAFTVKVFDSFTFFPQHIARQIALFHVGFNLTLSLLFLPFVRQGAWLLERLVPEPYREEEKAFGQEYLDARSLETPAVALANAKREILRMVEIVREMFRNVISVFERNDRERMAYIEEEDDKVDLLDREVKFYLAKISQEVLTAEQARMQLNLMAMTSDLESIGDIINKNILELAAKKIDKGRRFSEEGWREIVDFHGKVLENIELMISALTTEDVTIARKVIRHERHLAEVEARYREAHLQRLHKGLKETFETSSIHLDLLSSFRVVNSKLTTIVRASLPHPSDLDEEVSARG